MANLLFLEFKGLFPASKERLTVFESDIGLGWRGILALDRTRQINLLAKHSCTCSHMLSRLLTTLRTICYLRHIRVHCKIRGMPMQFCLHPRYSTCGTRLRFLLLLPILLAACRARLLSEIETLIMKRLYSQSSCSVSSFCCRFFLLLAGPGSYQKIEI